MKDRLLIALLLLALILPLASLAGAAEPGKRSDATPWWGWGSLTNDIIKKQHHIIDLRGQRTIEIQSLMDKFTHEIEDLKRKKAHAPDTGLPFVTDSKGDYQKKIDDALNERDEKLSSLENKYKTKLLSAYNGLFDSLASPPNDKIKHKMEGVRLGTSSHEALESYSAISNLKNILKQLNDELSKDKNNYDLAIRNYTVRTHLIKNVKKIQETFHDRIRHVYIPSIKDLINKANNRINKMNNNTNILKQVKTNEIIKLNKVIGALKKAIPQLKGNRQWSLNVITVLNKQIATTMALKQNAAVIRDASVLISNANDAFTKLDFEVPKLVEYDLKDTDLKIIDASNN